MLMKLAHLCRSAVALSLAAILAVPSSSADACQRRGYYGPAYYPTYVVPAYSPATYPVQVVMSAPAQPTTAALVAHAKAMLKARDYAAAQKSITAALAREPKNAALMQLKSLISFAQSDYQSAAATAYSALTLGRALDWNAIRQLYPSTDEYAVQYHHLTKTAREKPDQPHLQFLLAYHHLMLGHQKEGRMALEAARTLLPQDKLIPLLLSQLPAETRPENAPMPQTVAADDLPPAE